MKNNKILLWENTLYKHYSNAYPHFVNNAPYENLIHAFVGQDYKKFSNTPFTGEVSGLGNGKFKKGQKNREWLSYHQG